MLNKKTNKDLQNVITENKSVSVITSFWKEAQLSTRYNTFLNGNDQVDSDGNKINLSLKEKYSKLYPDVKYTTGKDFGGLPTTNETKINYIVYTETTTEPLLDENGNEVIDPITQIPATQEVPIIPEEYYDFDKDNNIKVDKKGNGILKKEYLEALAIPSYELFKQTEIDKFLNEPANQEVDMSTYPDFIKPILLEKVNIAFEKALVSITKKYPMKEQDSWSKQEVEAKAYIADNTATLELIPGIAEKRGITLDVLAPLILKKASELAIITGKAIGYRQYAEDLISTITSEKDVSDTFDILVKDRAEFNAIIAS